MAARSCMRLSQLFLNKSSKIHYQICSKRTLHATESLRTQSSILSCSVLKYCANIKASFSSQSTQKSSNVKILTDEILKATQPKQSEKEDESNKGSEDKKSEAFQKKAMKYTFLAFGSMFAGMVGLAVYEWGLYSYPTINI